VKAVGGLGETEIAQSDVQGPPEQHRLRASVPEELPAGTVRLLVFLSEEDEAGTVWGQGLAREWTDELSDSRQDLYTLADGRPVDATR
jgi:hypothetical protein